MKPDVFLACFVSLALSATTATSPATPFQGITPTVPGTVIGSNFDVGGSGVSYYLPQSGGGSSTYRSDSGAANLKANSDTTTGNACNVGTLATGSYFIYSVNVTVAGSYDVKLRVGSGTGGAFHLESDGTVLTGSVAVPVTGSWNTAASWSTIDAGKVTLTAGAHKLKLTVDKQYFDLNTITLSAGYTYGAAQPLWYTSAAATTVYLAPRTDGKAGSGTASDPYDASSAAKYDALVQRFKSNVDIYYAAGVYLTNGWNNATTTAGTNCRHLGAGIDQTIIRLTSTATGWVMFAVDYNQRADGFQMYNLTLDANANQNTAFQQHKTSVTQVNINGSNILFKNDKFIGFGTAIQGNECFPFFIGSSGYFAGQTFSHVHLDSCTFTSPATGNQDGCSISTVAADPSVNTVDFLTTNCQFLNVASDFTYCHALCGNICTYNTVNGGDVGWYSEPGSWGGSNVATAAAVIDHNTFINVNRALLLTFHPNGQWNAPVTFSNNTVTMPNIWSSSVVDINGSVGIFPTVKSMSIIGNTIGGVNQKTSDASAYYGVRSSGFGTQGPVIGSLTIQNNHFNSYVPSGQEFSLNTKADPQVTASGNVYSNGAQVGLSWTTQ
ncbi:MAG TPA: carbohydrate-binding protein [Chthoniobacterales bacterium]